jgi:hypothetical protein
MPMKKRMRQIKIQLASEKIKRPPKITGLFRRPFPGRAVERRSKVGLLNLAKYVSSLPFCPASDSGIQCRLVLSGDFTKRRDLEQCSRDGLQRIDDFSINIANASKRSFGLVCHWQRSYRGLRAAQRGKLSCAVV